jgi:hypothetical protein
MIHYSLNLWLGEWEVLSACKVKSVVYERKLSGMLLEMIGVK